MAAYYMTIKFGWKPSDFFKLPINEQIVIIGMIAAAVERKEPLGGGI